MSFQGPIPTTYCFMYSRYSSDVISQNDCTLSSQYYFVRLWNRQWKQHCNIKWRQYYFWKSRNYINALSVPRFSQVGMDNLLGQGFFQFQHFFKETSIECAGKNDSGKLKNSRVRVEKVFGKNAKSEYILHLHSSIYTTRKKNVHYSPCMTSIKLHCWDYLCFLFVV